MNTLILNPGSRWLKAKIYSENGVEMMSQKFEISNVSELSQWFHTLTNINKIGLRIVHGGLFTSPKLLDDTMRKDIEYFSSFAPLHNKVDLAIATLAEKHFQDVPIYCVFDTSFHQTIAQETYTYPIPTDIANKYKIRRYGFHGIALESVIYQLRVQKEHEGETLPEKLIVAHLGGGTSVTAIQNGKSINTSMGLTPLDGAMMIMRSGSIDPEVVHILKENAGYTVDEISEILNTKSGFKGITGSADTKQIIADALIEKYPQKLAFDMYIISIVEKIFSCYGVLQGANALIFSGGIGYNNEYIRPEIIKLTEIIGLTSKNTYTFQADESAIIFNYIKDL